uniref:DUF148 domain-containing protein n=1 Tax=Rhabditophanes sp. KR3021 TaxID=114890 RepID=A0AC35UBB1_9BILA
MLFYQLLLVIILSGVVLCRPYPDETEQILQETDQQNNDENGINNGEPAASDNQNSNDGNQINEQTTETIIQNADQNAGDNQNLDDQKAEQNTDEQSADQNKADQNNADQNTGDQDNAGQNNAEQNNADQNSDDDIQNSKLIISKLPFTDVASPELIQSYNDILEDSSLSRNQQNDELEKLMAAQSKDIYTQYEEYKTKRASDEDLIKSKINEDVQNMGESERILFEKIQSASDDNNIPLNEVKQNIEKIKSSDEYKNAVATLTSQMKDAEEQQNEENN